MPEAFLLIFPFKQVIVFSLTTGFTVGVEIADLDATNSLAACTMVIFAAGRPCVAAQSTLQVLVQPAPLLEL